MSDSTDKMVSISSTAPVLVANVTGELTNDTCNSIYEEINAAIEDATVGVVLELGAISYIDSTGLATLIKIGLEHRARIVNPSPKVSQLLELTQVYECISIASDVDQAKRELTEPNSAT